MKRILFYLIVLLQIIVIGILSWQYFLIDRYGESVDLLLEKGNQFTFNYVDTQGKIYVDYEINTIEESKWPKELSKDNKQRFFVILESDKDGVYHVEKVSAHKVTAGPHQVVLLGKYNYFDSSAGLINVTYGIEKIPDQNSYKYLHKNKSIIATVKVAPWGQKKVIYLENK